MVMGEKATGAADIKTQLRSRMRDLRLRMPEQDRIELSGRICTRFLGANLCTEGQVLSGYFAMKGEVDCMEIIRQHSRATGPTALPVLENQRRELLFRTWRPGDRLLPGPFGTRQPGSDREALEPDLLLVPLVAFSEAGGRLGYGGGHYDATLTSLRRSKLIVAVGLGYEAQRAEALPLEAHDQVLDWIVTEDRVIRACG